MSVYDKKTSHWLDRYECSIIIDKLIKNHDLQ
jgi:hypothetical protein